MKRNILLGGVIGLVVAGGYALAVYGYFFTGDYATWPALLGVGIAIQGQLGGMWFLLGRLYGKVSGAGEEAEESKPS